MPPQASQAIPPPSRKPPQRVKPLGELSNAGPQVLPLLNPSPPGLTTNLSRTDRPESKPRTVQRQPTRTRSTRAKFLARTLPHPAKATTPRLTQRASRTNNGVGVLGTGGTQERKKIDMPSTTKRRISENAAVLAVCVRCRAAPLEPPAMPSPAFVSERAARHRGWARLASRAGTGWRRRVGACQSRCCYPCARGSAPPVGSRLRSMESNCRMATPSPSPGSANPPLPRRGSSPVRARRASHPDAYGL